MNAIVVEREESIQFKVEVDGRPVVARISKTCLEEKFGMSGSLNANGADWYEANRARIDPVVAGKAHRGDAEPIVVVPADF